MQVRLMYIYLLLYDGQENETNADHQDGDYWTNDPNHSRLLAAVCNGDFGIAVNRVVWIWSARRITGWHFPHIERQIFRERRRRVEMLSNEN